MKYILPLLALFYMNAGANSDVSHGAKLDFIEGKKLYNQKQYVYASRLYKTACKKGLSDVCNTLAFMYIEEKIDSNYKEMVAVLNKSCDQDNAQGCLLLASTYKGVYTQDSDANKAAEVKAKGCKLLKDSTPPWQAHGKMEKWNCFAKVEPEIEPEPEVTLSNEIFTDGSTGLMWQDDGDAKSITKNWNSAKSHCEYLTLAGHSDWYLPSKEQLLALAKNNAMLKNTTLNYYWSATAFDGNDFGAWGVHLDKQRDDWGEKSGESYVRCVREETKQVKSYDAPTDDDSFSDATYATEYVEAVNDYTLVFKNKCDESIGVAYKVKKENGYEVSHSLHKVHSNDSYRVSNIVEKEVYYYAKKTYKDYTWEGKHTHRLGNGSNYKFGKIKMKVSGGTGTHTLHLTCPDDNQKIYKIIKIPSNDTLNVRRGAGTHNSKVDELAYNARGIKVTGCKKAPNGRKWCKVKHRSITTGWVSAKYLKLQ